MEKEWHELESDPGLFTLLIEDFGVEGVQVEEVYELQKPIEGPVLGFIFLFRWIEERRARRKFVTPEEDLYVLDEERVNNMFFAHQLIPDSCATHSLLSILLNTDSYPINLGPTLTELRTFSTGMCPQDKGFAIANMPKLAHAHNSHARPEPASWRREKQQTGGVSVRSGDAFHYASYVPMKGRLYEMDGLKAYPIDHGDIPAGTDWTDKFREVIKKPLSSEDIRFCLMAVVPDRRPALNTKLITLRKNRDIILNAFNEMESKMLESNKGKEVDNEPKTSEEEPIYRLRRSGRKSVPNPHYIQTQEFKEQKEDGTPRPGEEVSGAAAVPSIDMAAMTNDRRNVRISIQVSEEDTGVMSKPRSIDHTDFTKPLVISTRFGSSPVASDWSDATSEVGSTCSPALSTLGTPQTSPAFINPSRASTLHASTTDAQVTPKAEPIKTEVKVEVKTEVKVEVKTEVKVEVKTEEEQQPNTAVGSSSDVNVETRGSRRKRKADSTVKMEPDDAADNEAERKTSPVKHKRFCCSDLVFLLKKIESEITRCEQGLRDENEKRRKYKVDHCRRTHSYDKFIVTFLSMLAEQGMLADLVQNGLQNRRVAPSNKQAKNKKKPR